MRNAWLLLIVSCSMALVVSCAKPAGTFQAVDLKPQDFYTRLIPASLEGCFWARVDDPTLGWYEKLFLCCPSADGKATPFCQQAKWKR